MPSPKEKAKELVDKYHKMGNHYPQTTFAHAKQCAIICVNEMLEALYSTIGNQSYMWSENELEMVTHYKSVLQEINAL